MNSEILVSHSNPFTDHRKIMSCDSETMMLFLIKFHLNRFTMSCLQRQKYKFDRLRKMLGCSKLADMKVSKRSSAVTKMAIYPTLQCICSVL